MPSISSKKKWFLGSYVFFFVLRTHVHKFKTKTLTSGVRRRNESSVIEVAKREARRIMTKKEKDPEMRGRGKGGGGARKLQERFQGDFF